MANYEEHLEEAIQTGSRRQDPLNPQKHRYTKTFDDLAKENTHLVAIVLFRFSEDPQGQPVPNNYGVLHYQLHTRSTSISHPSTGSA
jgi:hypothetical protein